MCDDNIGDVTFIDFHYSDGSKDVYGVPFCMYEGNSVDNNMIRVYNDPDKTTVICEPSKICPKCEKFKHCFEFEED